MLSIIVMLLVFLAMVPLGVSLGDKIGRALADSCEPSPGDYKR